jgi:DNA-binding response OmpR family regulator
VLHGRIDGAELVAKPYTVAELVRRVRAVLDGPPPQESA